MIKNKNINKKYILLFVSILIVTLCYSIALAAATDINTCTITVTGTYDYDSYAKNATYTIVDPATGYELVESVDYSKKYVNNVDAGVDTAKIVFSGRRSYSGTVEKTFTINQRDLNITPLSNQSKMTGEADPQFKFTYSNNVDIEFPEFEGRLSRESGEVEGQYNILSGNLEMKDHGLFKASNYNMVVDETVPFTIEDKDCLTLEFTVPAGATLKLPIPSKPLNNFVVSWGDMTSDKVTTEGFVSHTYEDAGTYTVRISGRVIVFGYINDAEVDNVGTYKDYYSYCNYLTKIVSFGDIKAERLGFSMCKNLVGTIPESTGFGLLKSAENMFNGCDKLTGSIPVGFFKDLVGINSARNVFKGCTLLSGSLEPTLFEGCTRIRSYEGAFSGLINITGSIPEDLFKDSPNVTSFDSTFYGMVGLTGDIPSNLFKQNTIVYSFSQTFCNCVGLTGVPADIFETNNLATNYYKTFSYCRGFTEIPTRIFTHNRVRDISNSNTILDDYNSTFEYCTGVTYLSSDLYLIGYNMFAGCSSIKEILLIHPSQIGIGAFRDCNSLKTIKVGKDKLYEIDENAFLYTGTNPSQCITYINKDNDVLLAFAWADNNRVIDITPPKGTVKIITPEHPIKHTDTYPFTYTENVRLHIEVNDEVSDTSHIKIAILNDQKLIYSVEKEIEDSQNKIDDALAEIETLGTSAADLARKAELEEKIAELKEKINNLEIGQLTDDILEWRDYEEYVDWQLTSQEGAKIVYVYFKDEAGNVSNFKQEI